MMRTTIAASLAATLIHRRQSDNIITDDDSQNKKRRYGLENIKDLIQRYLETIEKISKDAESFYVEV